MPKRENVLALKKMLGWFVTQLMFNDRNKKEHWSAYPQLEISSTVLSPPYANGHLRQSQNTSSACELTCMKLNGVSLLV